MILRKLSSRVVCSPYKYILWPTAITFIISFPFLSFVLSDPLKKSVVNDYNEYFQVCNEDINADLFIRQAVIFPPTFVNPIDVTQTNITGTWSDEISNLRSSLTNNPNQLLTVDGTKLKDVQLPYVHFLSPDLSNLSISNYSPDLIDSLLLSPRIKDGYVKSSRGLLLSYISNDHDSTIWDSSISNVCCEPPPLPSSSLASKTTHIPINIIPQFPRGFLPLLFIYSTFAIYKDIVFTETRCVRSKTGLIIAQIVQILLAIFSSATITSLMYSQFCLSNLSSFISLPLIIIMGSIENMLELINCVSGTRPEISPVSRVATAIDSAFPRSIKLRLGTCLLLLLVLFGNFGQSINSNIIFTIFSILIDLALHMTYFTAVLSVDLHRLELDDLLSNPQDDDNEKLDNFSLHRSSNDTNIPFVRQYRKLQGFRLRAFLYLNYLNPRQRFPIVMSFLITVHSWFTYGSSWKGVANKSEFLPPVTLDRTILFINRILNITKRSTSLTIYNPIVLTFDDRLKCFNFSSSLSTTSSIMGGYSVFVFMEFIASLGFILSTAALILKILLPRRDYNEDKNMLSGDKNKFSSKDLVGYHTLDVIQIVVNRSWIATVSLDHGICVWNVNDGPSTTTKQNGKFRTLPSRLWPVSKVLLNGPNAMLVIISAHNSIIEAWDFKDNKIMYSVKDESTLSSKQQPFLSFIVGRDTVIITQKGAFVMISDTGLRETVCPDLTFGRNIDLIAATLLITPKINDKIVCLFSDNSVIVVTQIIGRQWNFRSLELLESLGAISEGRLDAKSTNKDTVFYRPYPAYPPIEIPEASSSSFIISSSRPGASIPCTRPMQMSEKACTIVPVPAIHMVLLITELTASLFDVHTGVIVRHFQLGLYKPETLRVFHAQPTHCRFCGCASIQSISIAYTDQEDKGLVICHSLQIENRAKNNICLRVERDPRETRCLGFEAATEHLHWIDRVEGWDATDVNMMMGVRRKEAPRTSFDSSSPDSGRMSPADGVERVDLSSSASTSVFRRISSKLSQSSERTTDRTKTPPQRQKKPPLHITWEGWAMTGRGEVSYYDIPDIAGNPGSYSIPYNVDDMSDNLYQQKASSRLLIRTVGPAVKYGKKSISVAFGNVIKILYFGTEEFHDEAIYGNRLVGLGNYDNVNSGSGGRRWKREVAY